MTVLLLASCGSFGEGFLAGIGNMGGYSYGGNSYMATANAGNMNYLLDPNYAVAQTMAQQQQYNQVFNNIAQQSVNQVLSEEEQEYQTFCKYNKKADGTNYTKNEWRALKGEAIRNMNGSNTSVGSSNSTVSGSGSSSRTNSTSGRGYYGVKQSRNKSKKIHVIPLIHRYFFDLISFISLTVKNLFLVHFCCTFVTRNKIIFITLTSEKPEWGHKIETNKSI